LFKHEIFTEGRDSKIYLKHFASSFMAILEELFCNV
jgi:hypothetical protein